MARDVRWDLLDQIEPKLLARFEADGVVAIRFAAGFPDLDGSSAWLCTSSDRQRDALDVPAASAVVRRIALEMGFSNVDAPMVVVESQETVDRDFEGSWLIAMR